MNVFVPPQESQADRHDLEMCLDEHIDRLVSAEAAEKAWTVPFEPKFTAFVV